MAISPTLSFVFAICPIEIIRFEMNELSSQSHPYDPIFRRPQLPSLSTPNIDNVFCTKFSTVAYYAHTRCLL